MPLLAELVASYVTVAIKIGLLRSRFPTLRTSNSRLDRVSAKAGERMALAKGSVLAILLRPL